MKKRIGIYLIYDSDGIVDDYIIHYLRELKKEVPRILIVCNGKILPKYRERLQTISDDIFCRDNIGYDAWAYKESLETIGWENLLYYDELVIANYTVYGPIHSFQSMFDYMDKNSSADYWGIQRRYKNENQKYFCGRKLIHGYMPEFPLSNFWVIRERILHSYEFKDYWDNLPPVNDYIDTCIINEPMFSKRMENAGFLMDTYSPGVYGETCPSPTIQDAFYQISEEKLPILRRRTFVNTKKDFLSAGYDNELKSILEYVDNETDYDSEMIFDNILRTGNMYDLNTRFNWTYIVEEDTSNYTISSSVKIGVIIHIYYEENIDECLQYLYGFSTDVEALITTSDNNTLKAIQYIIADKENIVTKLIPNRGRDISSLLIAGKDFIENKKFDLICFFHDKKMPHIKHKKVGDEFKKRCYSNIIGNKNVINNVIELFENNKRLGMISSPPPYHGEYYHLLGGAWSGNYSKVKELSEKLNLHVDISGNRPPVAPYGTCFWFRPDALKIIFDYGFKYDDFPEEPLEKIDNTILHAIERILAFVAQEDGFYSAYVLTVENAQTEISNYLSILSEVNASYRKWANRNAFNYSEFIRNFETNSVLKKYKAPLVKEKKQFNYEENLEIIPTKVLLRKLLKRLIPKALWSRLRLFKWKRGGGNKTDFERIVQKEKVEK